MTHFAVILFVCDTTRHGGQKLEEKTCSKEGIAKQMYTFPLNFNPLCKRQHIHLHFWET